MLKIKHKRKENKFNCLKRKKISCKTQLFTILSRKQRCMTRKAKHSRKRECLDGSLVKYELVNTRGLNNNYNSYDHINNYAIALPK